MNVEFFAKAGGAGTAILGLLFGLWQYTKMAKLGTLPIFTITTLEG
jgi:hypothetical protein